MIKKHYYYDGMGNRVAIVTEDVNTTNGTNVLQSYCYQVGIPYQGCEDCRKQIDFTVDTYYYEAGGKLLYKNKFSNHTDVTYVCSTTENDVEWYVYGSASDGRVATVYPRFKIQDNELYDNNFEDSPPNPAVAYNTEMVSNTFTAVAESAGITGIETHRHLGEKRYEIKDHLGNVRAVVSDIKNAENYSLSASSWKFLADVRSLSNYYPYGMQIEAGSWSGGDYNYGINNYILYSSLT